MPETKPPASQTKTAEQELLETAQGVLTKVVWDRDSLELQLHAKESELAALREQLERLNERLVGEKYWAKSAEAKLAASERIAEDLALQILRYKIHHTMLMQLAKDQNCDCAICIEAESVLARYQAQKGKP